MQLLPKKVYNKADFIEIFGDEAQNFGMQCAVVKSTTNRQWLRLVGRRHDVQHWNLDERIAKSPGSTPKTPSGRLLSYPRGLSASESWVEEILSPIFETYAKSMHLSIQYEAASENFCRLAGRLLPEMIGDDKTEEPLREIIVTRDPPVVQVFNVVEHGRRWYRFAPSDTAFPLHCRYHSSEDCCLCLWRHRQLTFCSMAGASLHDMKVQKTLLIATALPCWCCLSW